ncbi:MAG: hypothetical protein JW973_04620 [Bacteroidales bacterium]|nr:hypothetical protein [Bacteroidales bacterium]
MKKYSIHILFITLLFIAACDDEAELTKSVFIPDDQNPDLPAYTEWGYNTFGAYYERAVFKYNDWEVPAKIIVNEGKTSFILKGQKRESGYYYDNVDMTLTFELQGYLPSAYTDLIALNATEFDLTQNGNQVYFTINNMKSDAQILNGSLEFKRAQQLLVDKKQIEVILSGIFDLQALVDEEPISISLGRFDVGIGPPNFFIIP